MIYLKYGLCESDSVSQHKEAKNIRNCLLYEAFGINNADSIISVADGGKPYVKGFDIDFSDAHTENAAVVAACGDGGIIDGIICIDKDVSKIGVDIEWAGRPISSKSIALISQKKFSKKEQEYVAVGTNGDRLRFLEIWTKKESIIKATGEGLKSISRADSMSADFKLLKTHRIVIGDKSYIVSIAAF